LDCFTYTHFTNVAVGRKFDTHNATYTLF